MLSNIVNQPKSWFTNIKELAESHNNLDIYIPNTLTYNSLVEHSKSDSEDSIYFKQLLDRVKIITYSEIYALEKLRDLCDGKNALIFNSLKGDFFLNIVLNAIFQ